MNAQPVLPARSRSRLLFSHCVVFIGRRTLKGVRAAGFPTVAKWIEAFERPAADPATIEFRAAMTAEAERAVAAGLRDSRVSPETRSNLLTEAESAIGDFIADQIGHFPGRRDEVVSRFTHGMMRRATLCAMRYNVRMAVEKRYQSLLRKPMPAPLCPPTGEEATEIHNKIEQMIVRARKRAMRPNCAPMDARHMVAHVAALVEWRTRVLAGHRT